MLTVLYNFLTVAALPFALLYHWYRSVSRGRKSAIGERLGILSAGVCRYLAGGPVIWMHAVSVGEVIAARPLIKGLRKQYPGYRLLLSVTTETGRGVAEGDGLADAVIYFPFDFPPAVRHLLNLVSPKLVIIMETEIWPVFTREVACREIPILLANGRISDRSFPRYKRFAWFFRPILAQFTFLGMQSAVDLERLVAIGAPPERTRVLGNLKYDIAVCKPSQTERSLLRERYALPVDSIVFTAASTHPGEEQQIVAVWQILSQQYSDLRFVLVPRHPERAEEVAAVIEQNGFSYCRRTNLDVNRKVCLGQSEVLLVDTVGELADIYRLSDLVFVGGSLVPTGGHNLLEPAAAGVPSLFGPNMNNFREVTELVLQYGAGTQVADQSELREAASDFLISRELRDVVGGNGLKMMRDAGGATNRYLEAVVEVLAE